MVSPAAIVWIARIASVAAAVGAIYLVVDYIGDKREAKLITKQLVENMLLKEDLDEIRNNPVSGDDVIDSLRNGTF